jgi:hypothetical protein
MRPQQQNRRMRGRNNNGGGNNNNNNRRGPNPLTRNYESNGPDVKIRGSAQQIAEKYAALARDAQSAGDRVMAENYLQHAEHYNRIIAAAQAQMPIQQVQPNRDDIDDDLDQDREEFETVDGNANRQNGEQVQETPPAAAAASDGSGPQPVIEGTPAEVALNTQAATERPSGRGRGRRPARTQAQATAPAPESASPTEANDAAPAETATAETSQASENNEAPAAAPRPRRRPRRGERQPEQEAAADSERSEAPTASKGAEAADESSTLAPASGL